MQMRIRDIALAATVFAAAACGGGGDSAEEATPSTSTTEAEETTPSTTTSTTAAPEVDPTVIPDDPADIDEAYVEAVLEEHNRVIGDALRLQLEGADPKEIVDRYNAIYVPEVADLELTDILQMTPEEMASYRSPPGDGQSDVLRVREASPSCIVAEVVQDPEALVVDPPDPFDAEIVLRRAPDGHSSLNPTAWLSEGLAQMDPEAGELCSD